MNNGEVIGTGIACIGVIVLMLFLVAPAVPKQTQTASATTDYFSLSCSQLKQMVNDELPQGGEHDSGVHVNRAQAYLAIMQMKNCSVNSP